MLDAVTLLERAPDWLRRLAFRVAAGRGAMGRLADVARYRFSENEIPPVPLPSAAAVRVLIGPANSAGQGYQWARAIERHLTGAAAIDVQRPARDLPGRVELSAQHRRSL